jgi:hypothetical protein
MSVLSNSWAQHEAENATPERDIYWKDVNWGNEKGERTLFETDSKDYSVRIQGTYDEWTVEGTATMLEHRKSFHCDIIEDIVII